MLNNGGIAVLWYEKSKSGHERIIQINCYVLISLKLFPPLQTTAAARGSPTRITWVGSGTQTSQNSLLKKPISPDGSAIKHFDDLAKFDKWARYADTKLAVNAYARRLAAIAPSQVIVNNVCPGFVQTRLDQNLPLFLKTVMTLLRKMTARDVEGGARTNIYVSAVSAPETNGKLLQDNKISQ